MSVKSIRILDYKRKRALVDIARRDGLDVQAFLTQAELRGQPVKGEAIEASLRDDLSPQDLIDAETQWGPERLALLQRCQSSGVPTDDWPQHWHWNWAAKAAALRILAYKTFGVFAAGQWQGMIMSTTLKQ